MAWNPFKPDGSPGGIIEQANQAVAKFEAEHAELEVEKTKKMQRQVELWSVMTPSDELRNEYKAVSAHIAFVIKKMLCLDAHLKELKLARYHAQNGNEERLEKALAIVDPCVNIAPSISELAYQQV